MSLTPLPQGTLLAPYSHLRVGGTAAAVFAPASIEEMQELLPTLCPERTVFLGGGSNLLLPAHTDRTVVLDRNMPATLKVEGDLMHATSACSISRIIARGTESGLGGLEFVAGLPAHLGGLLCMNAGAWGQRIGNLVHEVTVVDWDGSPRTLAGSEVEWGYRVTSLRGYIAGTVLRLTPGDPAAIEQAVQDAVSNRCHKHPMDMPTLGCFFKNPEGGSAGKLIDESGLKGLRQGGALVSSKHANIIVNDGGATYEDMLALAGRIRRIVFERTGVWLEPEVRIVPPAEGGIPWS